MSLFKGGLGELMQQAQKMQQEFQRLQEESAKMTTEVTAGGGMVKVKINGKQQLLSLEIDPEVLKMNDKQMLQDLVLAGVNQAIKASQEMVAEEMKKLSGGLGPLSSMLKGLG